MGVLYFCLSLHPFPPPSSPPTPFLDRLLTRQERVVRFDVGIRVCDASTPRPRPVFCQSSSPVDPAEYPARAARQWIASIPPERLTSGSRRISRQSSSPVDPASIPPELLASGSHQVSRQSGSPVRPAKYPARAARQSIPPSIPAERLASGSRRVSQWIAEYPAEYPGRVARQWIPPSIPPEQLASLVLLNAQKGRWELGVEVYRMRRNLL